MFRMKSLLSKILLLFILGTTLHLTFIYYYPYFKMWQIDRNNTSMSVNKITHGKKIDSNYRDIIRPSPDLLYSACSYDTTYSPVIITSDVLDTYWAMSFYSSNSDNYAIINDMDIDDSNVKVYLFGPNSKPTKINDGYAIFSPSNKGAVLIRRFLGNESNIDELYKNQESLTCDSLDN